MPSCMIALIAPIHAMNEQLHRLRTLISTSFEFDRVPSVSFISAMI